MMYFSVFNQKWCQWKLNLCTTVEILLLHNFISHVWETKTRWFRLLGGTSKSSPQRPWASTLVVFLTCAAVRSKPRFMCTENVTTLAITMTIGATPTVILWKYPAFSRIRRSSSRTSKMKSRTTKTSQKKPRATVPPPPKSATTTEVFFKSSFLGCLLVCFVFWEVPT